MPSPKNQKPQPVVPDDDTFAEMDSIVDGAQNATDAFRKISGATQYALKIALAESGEPFTIVRLAERTVAADAKFNPGSKEWQVSIERDTGRVEEITLSRGERRDTSMYGLHLTLSKFGAVPGIALQRIIPRDTAKSEFYVFVPADEWQAPGTSGSYERLVDTALSREERAERQRAMLEDGRAQRARSVTSLNNSPVLTGSTVDSRDGSA